MTGKTSMAVSGSSSIDFFTRLENVDSIESYHTLVSGELSTSSSVEESDLEFQNLSTPLDHIKNGVKELKNDADTPEKLKVLSDRINSLVQKLLNLKENNKGDEDQLEDLAPIIHFLSNEKAEINAQAPLKQESDPSFTELCDLVPPPPPNTPNWLTHTWQFTRKAVNTASYYLQHPIIEDSKLENIPEQYRHITHKLINQQASRLNSSDFKTFVDFLENDFSSEEVRNSYAILDSAIINSHCINNREPSKQLENYLDKAALKSKKLVFIPFVFKGNDAVKIFTGFDLGHIVLVVIDTEAKKVEYYDSNGDRPESKQCYEGFCMKEDLENVRKFFFADDTESSIHVLTNNIQQDFNNCGVHVMDIMGRRIGGETFEEIEKQKVDSDEPLRIRTAIVRSFATKSDSDPK